MVPDYVVCSVKYCTYFIDLCLDCLIRKFKNNIHDLHVKWSIRQFCKDFTFPVRVRQTRANSFRHQKYYINIETFNVFLLYLNSVAIGRRLFRTRAPWLGAKSSVEFYIRRKFKSCCCSSFARRCPQHPCFM